MCVYIYIYTYNGTPHYITNLLKLSINIKGIFYSYLMTGSLDITRFYMTLSSKTLKYISLFYLHYFISICF